MSKQMRNQFIMLTLFFSFLINGLHAEEKYDSFLDQEIEQLSFYMGYLIGRDHAKNSYGFPTKFNKLVEGMKAGIAGETVLGKEELTPLIKRMQKTIVERQAALNLQEAENYLKTISQKQNYIELEPSKLFYLIEKQGEGPLISAHPLLHFKMNELKDGELHLSYSTFDDQGEPLQVDLDAVVPGFQKGVQGMKIGEARTIYVHPDLAFGLGKLDIAPNRLIVFEVTASQTK
jgi:peptidylprolyl isomerase